MTEKTPDNPGPTPEELALLLEQQERNHAALARERTSYRDAWKYERVLRLATRRRMRLAGDLHRSQCPSQPCDLCRLLELPPPFPPKEEIDL